MTYLYSRCSGALRVLTACLVLSTTCSSVYAQNKTMTIRTWSNPVTRYIHVTYRVPVGVPDEVQITCSWSHAGKDDWHPACVSPLISETGLGLLPDAGRSEWASGRVTERRAAGLERTVIFDPYPEAQVSGRVDADFRIDIRKPSGEQLSSQTVHVRADNSDVVYLTDWSQVFQKDLISTSPVDGKWLLSKDPSGVSHLSCKGGIAVPAITYPLDLKGCYAIFVSTDPSVGSIGLRLSGDERTERVSSSKYEKEVLWRWTGMDCEHLVIKQRHYYTGYSESSLNYVKLVPLSKKIADNLNARVSGKHNKFVGVYYEPGNWAFYGDVRENYQHREPLSAFAETGVDQVDVCCGRFGAKSVYETRIGDQLIYETEGDPIAGTVPVTDNLGKMQQYTNMLSTQLKYAREMGLRMHAMFGATACYPSTPSEGKFSKEHPDWRRDDSLLLNVPGVQDHMLANFREVLEIGAPGISIDYCRYPDGVDSAKDSTAFMRRLRKLADKFSRTRGKHVTILVRFPSTGTRRWKNFDYKTWAREGLVDYLCPSNLQGVYQFFDIKPYLEAVKGTKCKLTPEMDALEWGPVMPGQMLMRAKQLYDSGADGVYIYQADDVLYSRSERECISLLKSTEGIDRWLRNHVDQRSHCSKGIYITGPSDGRSYNWWERLRIWTEGVEMGELETYLDGKLIGKMKAPPYLLGTDGYESDKVVPTGEHVLLIRVKDGNGWLEQKFNIMGA